DPNLAEARRFRGILWARCGDFEAAGNDIHWCLERDPTCGGHVYAAACITALAAKRVGEARRTQLASSAADLLEPPFALGCGKEKAANDSARAGLRAGREFGGLLKQECGTRRQECVVTSQSRQ